MGPDTQSLKTFKVNCIVRHGLPSKDMNSRGWNDRAQNEFLYVSLCLAPSTRIFGIRFATYSTPLWMKKEEDAAITR